MGGLGRIGAGVALLALAGCGTVGQFNPLNLFISDRPEIGRDADGIPGSPIVDQVVSVTVDPTPGGAIISAVGLPPTQGFWLADLVEVPSEDPATLVLDFQVEPPLTPSPAGTQPSREVLVGAFYSNQDLAGVRTIVVRGERASRSITRR